MAYDRDSFLSGLVVGRTLWKPPYVLAGGGELFIASAFPFQPDSTWSYWHSEVPLNWTWNGESFSKIHIVTSGPELFYWCVVYNDTSDLPRIFMFSDTLPYHLSTRVVRIYGITQSEEEVLCNESIGAWTKRNNSRYIKADMSIGFASVSTSQFLNEFSQAGYLYYDGPNSKVSGFLNNSILVGADQKYLAGFVYD